VGAAVEFCHEIRVIGQHPAQHDGVVLVGAQPGLAGRRRLLNPVLQALSKFEDTHSEASMPATSMGTTTITRMVFTTFALQAVEGKETTYHK